MSKYQLFIKDKWSDGQTDIFGWIDTKNQLKYFERKREVIPFEKILLLPCLTSNRVYVKFQFRVNVKLSFSEFSFERIYHYVLEEVKE